MQPADPETPNRFDDAALDACLRTASARRAAPAIADGDAGATHADDGALLALVSGRLESDEAAHVEAHLVGCAECRALLAELSRPVPESALTAALAAFPAAPPAPATRRNVVRIVGALGVLAAAVLLAVGLGGPKQHPDFDWVAGYRAEAIGGGVQTVRTNVEQLPESRDFVETSNVTWVIRAQEAAPASVVTVFVGPANGALRRVDLAPRMGGEGTLELNAPAATLLGPAPGEKLLVVAVGRAAIDLAGKTAADLDTAVDAADGVLFRKTLTYSLRSPISP